MAWSQRLTHVLARVGTALLFADDEFTHTLVAGWVGSGWAVTNSAAVSISRKFSLWTGGGVGHIPRSGIARSEGNIVSSLKEQADCLHFQQEGYGLKCLVSMLRMRR